MHNNWRKKYSFSLATMLLLSSFAQTAAPLTAYAETETESKTTEVVDPDAGKVDETAEGTADESKEAAADPVVESGEESSAESGSVMLMAVETDATISVADAIARENDGTEATVKGYIVGHLASGPSLVTSEFIDDYSVAIADDPNEDNVANVLAIKLVDGNRTKFGLQSDINNFGKEIIVTGETATYHGADALLGVSSIEYTGEVGDIDTPPITEEPKELDLLTIEDARAQNLEEQVKTKGIVTAKLSSTVQIQDETGAIALFPGDSLDVELGDEITVEGALDEFNGLLQIKNPTVADKVEGSEVPKPVPLDGVELKDHQSELAIMENIEITAEDGKNYTAKDKSGTEFTIRDENGNLGLTVGTIYESITGIVSYYNAVQLIPRDINDVIEDSNIVIPVTASHYSGNVPMDTEITLSSRTSGVTIYYTTDGSEPTESSTVYTEPITLENDQTIKAIAVVDDRKSELSEFTYTVVDITEGNKIHEIQGEAHYSPMDGENVYNVKGVVTYVYELNNAYYFHMQTPDDMTDDNDNTSEGIVVYTGNNSSGVKIGDLVEVTGEVSEYYIDGYGDKDETDLPVTQINARDDQGGIVDITKSDVELPSSVEVTSGDLPGEIKGGTTLDVFDPDAYSLDYWESIEGMRVEVQPSRAVAPQAYGDLFVATEDYTPSNTTVNGGLRLSEDGPDSRLIPFKLHPNDDAENFAVKTGDKFTESIDGVVNYGFGNYKIYSDLADMKAAHVSVEAASSATSIVKNDSKLTVATYNVENFSANIEETSDIKAQRIASTFVNDMNEPDIIGIVEVQDDDGEEASNSSVADASYQRLIDEISAAGGPTYAYANIDPEYNADGGAPGGNIRVGFLYNPDRVSLIEKDKGGATEAVDYVDGELTLNPGRVNPSDFEGTRKPLAAEFEFNGESVVVIANHLNSKRGDDPYYGQVQPPQFDSRIERNQLAQSVNSFVDEILAENPDENVVVLGDMNDFEFSEPLEILAGDALTNLTNKVPASDRYSYVYQGNSQVLDHILVSNNIADTAEIDMIHVNADFTDMHSRASDHEPVLAQIDLRETFDFSVMHMNDTHGRVENYPNMLTAIEEFRGENPDSMLVHAGDVFSGTLYFNEFKGLADLALLNMMDIDVMTFGNHEFDLGDEENGHQSLAEFVEKANFPFLGTNVDFSEDKYMAPFELDELLEGNPEDGKIYETIVKEINGEKIGIFGLVTQDTENISSPRDVSFSDFVNAAEAAVQSFEHAGINKIMAVNHLGFDTAPEVGNDMRVAMEVDGIDVIVGGHSHSELDEPYVVTHDDEGNEKEPTVIVQGGQYAGNLGTLNVEFDADGKVIAQSGALLDTGEYPADEDALVALAKYKDRVDEIANEKTGAVAVSELVNPRHGEGDEMSVRADETRLGNLITDAMLAKAQEKFPEAVIAVQNGGGIRAGINEGPITVGEVLTVLPFGNNPVIAELSGQEIKDIMEHSVRQAPAENGGFLQVSGMEFYFDSARDAGDRIVEMYIDKDGELTEIAMDEMYLVTTNGFTGQGGDGFETFAQAFEEGRVRDIGEED
ncbi:5'-nucleotidase C-terminal domain-containing protein, partial [Alkalibacterium putridalgicola]